MFPDTVINLLIQIPLVGIFVWSSLETMKRQDAREAKRDDMQATERQARDAAWREFLAEQRSQNNLAIARIAEEVKVVTQEVSKMSAILSAHDASSKERYAVTSSHFKE